MSSSEAVGGFIHLTRAWYAKSTLQDRDFVDEVAITSLPNVDRADFAVRWIRAAAKAGEPPAPRLELFDDAWGWLDHAAAQPFFHWLAEVECQSVTPEQVCEKLISLGFRDETPVEEPGSSGGGGA